MKIIYALMAACLSLQACNNQSPSASTNANEYSTAEYLAAMSLFEADHNAMIAPQADLYVDEYNVGPITQSPVKPINSGAKSYEDDYAMWTSLPAAEYWIDTESGGHDYTATVTSPAIKPIDGAEFEGTSQDDASTPWSSVPPIRALDDYAIDSGIDADDHTATVTSPASEPRDENSSTTAPASYFEDDGFDFKLPAPIDQHAIQATDWW